MWSYWSEAHIWTWREATSSSDATEWLIHAKYVPVKWRKGENTYWSRDHEATVDLSKLSTNEGLQHCLLLNLKTCIRNHSIIIGYGMIFNASLSSSNESVAASGVLCDYSLNQNTLVLFGKLWGGEILRLLSSSPLPDLLYFKLIEWIVMKGLLLSLPWFFPLEKWLELLFN